MTKIAEALAQLGRQLAELFRPVPQPVPVRVTVPARPRPRRAH